MTHRIAIAIEYDGSAYSGWQTQQSRASVQQQVESALSGVAAEAVAVICAGRTDAGVHARWQVGHFETHAARSARGWVLGANTALPPDISLVWARSVPAHFHARYSAEARTYRYLILNRNARSALAARRAMLVHKPLDQLRMAAAAAALCGRHDFSAFRSAECQSHSPVRYLESLTVSRAGDWLTIEATANAFLHHMMRNIAGLLISIGRGDAPSSWAAEVLAGRERSRGAPTAPAEGLYLWAVRYPTAFGLPDPLAAQAAGSASHGGQSIIIPQLP
ncbi:MAG: tRNA pseudouridine(38-40) synthase TruA [Sinobacteraceae bacterium]|nr:tRNA pseudouridine(38-40) synthase TruA [Nevskiaceae bacterium]